VGRGGYMLELTLFLESDMIKNILLFFLKIYIFVISCYTIVNRMSLPETQSSCNWCGPVGF